MQRLSDRTIDMLNENLTRLTKPLWPPNSPAQQEIEAYVKEHPERGPFLVPLLQQGAQAHLQMLIAYTGILALLGITPKQMDTAKDADEDFLKKLLRDDKAK